MKNLIAFYFLLCFFSVQSNAQKLNCDLVRTGDFVEHKGGGDKTYIKRTKKFQFEYNPKSGVKIKMKVIWLDKCTYKLVFLEGNDKWTEEFGDIKFDNLIVSINDFGDGYYSHVAVFENAPNDEEFKSNIYLAPKK